MSNSQTMRRSRGPASIRFPSEWSRALSNRSEGLFKKANTLFHMERPKIAVLVSSAAQSYGYVSHAPEDWPELHQLAGSHGVVLATPDDLDTVSQRYGSRTQSVASSSSSTTLFNQAEQDSIMHLLATLEEEPEAMTQPAEQIPLTQAWSLPSTPERITNPLETKAPVAQMSTEPLSNNSSPRPELREGTTLDYNTGVLASRAMDSRINKKRIIVNGKGARGVTTRSRGVRSSKRRH